MRKYDGQWQSRSIECPSLSDVPHHLAGYLADNDWPATMINKREERPGVNPGRILRQHQRLFDFLGKTTLPGWKVIFRVQQVDRFITRGRGRNFHADFFHRGILVKFKPGTVPYYIDIGEGGGEGAKFNQAGLISRIEEILENFRGQRDIAFSGPVPVILNAGDGAILFHEIMGHSLEADYLYQGISPFTVSDLGRQVMSRNVTLTTEEDGDDFFKGVVCDDEGEPRKPRVLVRNGVLKNFIADSFYGQLLNLKNCGYCRLENFTHQPMPRMFSLYLKPGTYHPEELIASTPLGVYAREFGQGRVFFQRNHFLFQVKDAVLIEKGRLTAPLGPVQVRGEIMATLKGVEMVADDFRFDKGIGYCFKNGQTVNIRVGQPTIKIKNLVISKGQI